MIARRSLLACLPAAAAPALAAPAAAFRAEVAPAPVAEAYLAASCGGEALHERLAAERAGLAAGAPVPARLLRCPLCGCAVAGLAREDTRD